MAAPTLAANYVYFVIARERSGHNLLPCSAVSDIVTEDYFQGIPISSFAFASQGQSSSVSLSQ